MRLTTRLAILLAPVLLLETPSSSLSETLRCSSCCSFCGREPDSGVEPFSGSSSDDGTTFFSMSLLPSTEGNRECTILPSLMHEELMIARKRTILRMHSLGINKVWGIIQGHWSLKPDKGPPGGECDGPTHFRRRGRPL